MKPDMKERILSALLFGLIMAVVLGIGGVLASLMGIKTNNEPVTILQGLRTGAIIGGVLGAFAGYTNETSVHDPNISTRRSRRLAEKQQKISAEEARRMIGQIQQPSSPAPGSDRPKNYAKPSGPPTPITSPAPKTRPEPDPDLVKRLRNSHLPTREAAIAFVLANPGPESLSAVEEAIRTLSGKTDITFYKPGGYKERKPAQQVMNEVLEMAMGSQFMKDPAYLQSLIPMMGAYNQPVMVELGKIDNSYQALYQLLGVQMQLALQLGH